MRRWFGLLLIAAMAALTACGPKPSGTPEELNAPPPPSAEQYQPGQGGAAATGEDTSAPSTNEAAEPAPAPETGSTSTGNE